MSHKSFSILILWACLKYKCTMRLPIHMALLQDTFFIFKTKPLMSTWSLLSVIGADAILYDMKKDMLKQHNKAKNMQHECKVQKIYCILDIFRQHKYFTCMVLIVKWSNIIVLYLLSLIESQFHISLLKNFCFFISSIPFLPNLWFL